MLAVVQFTGGCGEPIPSELATCDIRSGGCQVGIYNSVADLMGAEFAPRPPVRVITPAEFETELREGVDDDALTGEDPASRGYRLMGFIPEQTSSLTEDRISNLSTGVAAYYASSSKAVTVIDRQYDPGDANAILAHEFAHSIQDAQFDLRSISTPTEDARIVRSSVVEGDAQHFTVQWMYDQAEVPIDETGWNEVHTTLQERVLMLAGDFAEPFFDPVFSFPYAYGFEYMTDAFLAGGFDQRAAEWGSPPAATLEIMFGFELVLAEALPELSSPTLSHPGPPEGYIEAVEDKLGAWTLFVFLRRSGLSEDDAWANSLDWVGDKFSIYDDGERVVSVWHIRYAVGASASASETIAALEDAPGTGTWAGVQKNGRDAYLIAVEDPGEIGAWAGF